MERIRIGTTTRSFTVLLVLISVSLAGCGSKRNAVSGKVTYKGKALPSGVVVFIPENGKAIPPAAIAGDGTYTANDVPLGRVAVCVDVLPPAAEEEALPPAEDLNPKTKKAPPTPNYVRIPEKYSDPKQSGLSFEVKPGANVFDIVLQEARGSITKTP